MADITRNSHYVPRATLKRWSDDGTHVHAYRMYGHVPGKPFRNPKKLSITELEYQRAGKAGLPRLVFLKDEGAVLYARTDAKTKEHRGVGWVDVHLLASAIVGRMQLWTVDPRFSAVARDLGVAYHPCDRHSAVAE